MKRFLFTILAFLVVGIGYIIINKQTLFTRVIHPSRLTYSGNGITFEYPATLSGNTWRTITWPPKVTVVSPDQDPIALGCPDLQDSSRITESGGGTSTTLSYRYYKGQDAGAGSLFTRICYIFSGTQAHYVVDFEIRSHTGCGDDQCWAYCDTPNEQECRDFDMSKHVIQPIETIISTFKIIQ